MSNPEKFEPKIEKPLETNPEAIEEVPEKEFKKFKEVYKEYLRNQDLIIETGIGNNPNLYQRVRKNGFKKEYVGVNFEDTMPIKPKGLDYKCFDALGVERINKLINDKKAIIVSHGALKQILQEKGELRQKRETEEAVRAMDLTHTNRYLHFLPTSSVTGGFLKKKEYQRFIKMMEEKGWKAKNLRIKEFYIKNYPDSDLALLLERKTNLTKEKPEEKEKFEPKIEPEIGKQSFILDKEHFRDFIEFRKIAPEDLELIEKLSHFSKMRFSEFHNFFNLSKENSVSQLENQIKFYKEEIEGPITEQRSLVEERIAFCRTFLEFARKYDWCACWHLNGIFERTKKEESYVQSRKNKN